MQFFDMDYFFFETVFTAKSVFVATLFGSAKLVPEITKLKPNRKQIKVPI